MNICYGDTIRIVHLKTSHTLHSHPLNFPTGSCQQEVTCFGERDGNDFWKIMGPHNSDITTLIGTPVRNGGVIRLHHESTGRNLHSHIGFPSAVTKQQEVTCYKTEGYGNADDNWRIECKDIWAAIENIRLIHSNTNHSLHSHKYNYLLGSKQQEVTGYSIRDINDFWYAEIVKEVPRKDVTLTPVKELAFMKLLLSIHHYLFTEKKIIPPKCFISYAWEVEEQKKKIQHEWLSKFKDHLNILQVIVFLDLDDMELNMKDTMIKNITDSDFIIIICTPRYKQRVQEQSNARFELDTMLKEKKKTLPIIYEKDYSASVPDSLKDSLVIDFTKTEDYFKNMIGYHNPKGIIPTIFGIKSESTYEQMVNSFCYNS